MGLDITYYRKLTPDPDAKTDSDGFPLEEGVTFYINDDFPGRADPIQGGVVYLADEAEGFRAGSYSGYGAWRNWLATVAGYKGAEDFWTNADESAPFFELINFSDCEGVIGSIAAAELAKDFAAHTPDGDEWELALYARWKSACEMAADGGAIQFH